MKYLLDLLFWFFLHFIAALCVAAVIVGVGYLFAQAFDYRTVFWWTLGVLIGLHILMIVLRGLSEMSRKVL